MSVSLAPRATVKRSAEELEALAERGNLELGSLTDHEASPADVVAWVAENFGTDAAAVACSMADAALPHLVAEQLPGVDVLFLDTGYHFAETIGTRDAFAATAQITLHTILPLRTVAEQDAEHGPRLHDRDPNLCCALRKVEPLERGLAPYSAWVTGMRREDAPTRTDITVVGWDVKRDKVKLNPLAAWTQADVDAYVEEHHVVLNPLRLRGQAAEPMKACWASWSSLARTKRSCRALRCCARWCTATPFIIGASSRCICV